MPGPAGAPRSVDGRPALGDESSVPTRPILIAEQDDLAVDDPRITARIVQQHQRDEALHLGLVGHEPTASTRVRRMASAERSVPDQLLPGPEAS